MAKIFEILTQKTNMKKTIFFVENINTTTPRTRLNYCSLVSIGSKKEHDFFDSSDFESEFDESFGDRAWINNLICCRLQIFNVLSSTN